MIASGRVGIDGGGGQLVISSNRYSHAACAFEELWVEEAVVEARRPFCCERIDGDARPDLDVPLQQRLGRAVPSWPLLARYEDATLVAIGTHLTRSRLLEFLRQPAPPPLPPLPVPPRATVGEALAAVAAAYDHAHGGFDPPPKPPRSALLELLLDLPPTASFDFRQAALHTLDALVQGGLHDQLGGGFHFYSTDERWVVPHFEKRTTDQAALLCTFARAAQAGPARYGAVARRLVAYVECRLALDEGGYAVAEAADVGPYDDGSYYTWTLEEARAVLDEEELMAAQPYFDLYGRGELHSDPTRNVLFVAATLEAVARELRRPPAAVQALISRARDKLLQARGERPGPPVQLVAYAGVAAQLARAYLECEAVLGTRERERALLTLERLYRGRTAEGLVARRLDASDGLLWLADQAAFGLAALAAWKVTGDLRHLQAARRLVEALLAGWWHPGGGFVATPASEVRPFRDDEGGAGPSGNALAGLLLWRLGEELHEQGYRQRAEALCEALLPWACGAAQAGAGLLWLRLVAGVGA